MRSSHTYGETYLAILFALYPNLPVHAGCKVSVESVVTQPAPPMVSDPFSLLPALVNLKQHCHVVKDQTSLSLFRTVSIRCMQERGRVCVHTSNYTRTTQMCHDRNTDKNYFTHTQITRNRVTSRPQPSSPPISLAVQNLRCFLSLLSLINPATPIATRLLRLSQRSCPFLHPLSSLRSRSIRSSRCRQANCPSRDSHGPRVLHPAVLDVGQGAPEAFSEGAD